MDVQIIINCSADKAPDVASAVLTLMKDADDGGPLSSIGPSQSPQPAPVASGSSMIAQMSNEEFERDRSDENPMVGKLAPTQAPQPAPAPDKNATARATIYEATLQTVKQFEDPDSDWPINGEELARAVTESVVAALKARKKARMEAERGDAPEPTLSNRQGGIAGSNREGRDGRRIVISGNSTARVLMDNFGGRGRTFTVADARKWMADAGYHPNSARPALSYAEGAGACVLIRGQKEDATYLWLQWVNPDDIRVIGASHCKAKRRILLTEHHRLVSAALRSDKVDA